MAKVKKAKTKKPAATKKSAARKKPAAKKKPTAKKKFAAKKKPAAKQAPAASSEVEQQVASLLQDYEDGNVDNAFDVIGDMYEMDQKLSKSSPLRKAFDKMYADMAQLCAESAGVEI